MAQLKTMKAALRREVRQTIALLTAEHKKRQSDIVVSKLLSQPIYKKSSRVSVYLNMEDEIQTHSILQDIFKSGKVCYIPRYDMNNTNMDMVRLLSMADLDELPTTEWNVKQPLHSDVREDALESGGLDLIIVPGMAFTVLGSRLGRGRGYYDNYFKKCRQMEASPPVTVALAFREQIVHSVPKQEFDVDVDIVLFPDEHS